MCGRYVVAYDPATLVQGFSLTRIAPFDRRWNVAPQSDVPVIYQRRDEGDTVCDLMRWGLVPHWAGDPAVGARMNNARLEGVTGKPSFRLAVRRRRCLIPASGFYEWQPVHDARGRPAKQPWYFSPAHGEPWWTLAGLFEAWRPADASDDTPWLLTCCILTREANATLAPVHDRMPAIVPPAWRRDWLDRSDTDAAAVLARCLPATPAEAMQAWPVDRAVGNARKEGESLTQPLTEPAPG